MNEKNTGTELTDSSIVVTIYDRQGKPYNATLLTTFRAGELNRDYCALLSHEPDADGRLPIQIFRYELTEQDGQEGMRIMNISSDMEFEEAREVLLTLIDENN